MYQLLMIVQIFGQEGKYLLPNGKADSQAVWVPLHHLSILTKVAAMPTNRHACIYAESTPGGALGRGIITTPDIKFTKNLLCIYFSSQNYLAIHPTT